MLFGIDVVQTTIRYIGTLVHAATACRSSSFGQVDCEGGPVGAQARLRVRKYVKCTVEACIFFANQSVKFADFLEKVQLHNFDDSENN